MRSTINLTDLLKSIQSNHKQSVKVMLDQIKISIQSGNILGCHKMMFATDDSLFSLKIKSHAKKTKIYYVDLSTIIQDLAYRPGYHDVLADFLSVCTFDQMDVGDFAMMITRCLFKEDKNINNEQHISMLLNAYIRMGGEFKYSLVETLKLIIQHDYQQSLALILSHPKYDASQFLAALLSGEELRYVINHVNLSEATLPFINIKEPVLIAFFNAFPDRLKQIKKVNYYDDRNTHDRRWVEGNLYDYACYNQYHHLLKYLFEKETEKYEAVFGKNIKSVEAVQLLFDHDVKISDQEENIFCIEYHLSQNKILNFFLSSFMVEEAIKNKLPHLIHYALKNGDEKIFNHRILSLLFFHAEFANKHQLLEKVVAWINERNKLHQYDTYLVSIFNEYVVRPGNPHVIETLFNHVPHLKKLFNPDIISSKTPLCITDPIMICLLLKHDFFISYHQKKKAYLLATLQSDEQSKTFLSTQLKEEDRVSLWKYCNPSPSESIKAHDEAKLRKRYGSGISQTQYLKYQDDMINHIVLHVLFGDFKFLPNNFQKVIKKLASAYTDESERAQNKMCAYLEEKYFLTCNFFTLGAQRHWIANASLSDHPGFGRYRIDEEDARFTTANSNTYRRYFEEFFMLQFERYKNTSYIKINNPNAHRSSPKCTIIGFINHEPIPLTTYGETGYGYGWIHTESEHLPKILSYCDQLIEKIIGLTVPHDEAGASSHLFEQVGRLHWWLAHACAYERGSASVTEVICKAMFKIHGLAINWELMPDCVALISPSVDEYAKRYASLMGIMPLALRNEGEAMNPTASPLPNLLRS